MPQKLKLRSVMVMTEMPKDTWPELLRQQIVTHSALRARLLEDDAHAYIMWRGNPGSAAGVDGHRPLVRVD